MPILLLLAGLAVVGKIYTQSVAIAWSGEVMERKGVLRDLELRNAEAERAIATLMSRDRVARAAGQRLGMVVPTEKDVLWLTVLDRTPPPAVRPASSRDPKSVVRDWLDALWQEEALALTSQ